LANPVDKQDRAVIITANQHILIYAIQDNQIDHDPIQNYNLAPAINNPSDVPNSVLPDNVSNLWFITKLGAVGSVNPSTWSVQGSHRGKPKEMNSKSFATDGQGGVYVVSDYALYRFQVGPNGAPVATWRTKYDRGRRVKPGQVQQGSGTTPTVFDDFAGNHF